MNLVYLHTHDTGCVVSPYGYAVDTPHIQELCEHSVVFQHAFSVAPTCSPSRAGLLTGTYPHQNGMLGLAQRGFTFDARYHLARVLSSHGWHSVLCGVQHEVGYYTDHQLAVQALGYDEDLTSDPAPYSEQDLVIWDQLNAQRAAAWIESYADDKPFFMSFGQHATHREWPEPDEKDIDYARPPVNIPNNETTRVDYAGYLQSVRMADANIGLVVEALKKSGHYDNTIIVLTTDHGLAYPMHKCTLKDAGTAVMLSLRVPNSQATISTFDGLISHIDVVPTLLELLDVEAPSVLEGVSHASIFRGEKDPGDEAVFAEVNFHTSYEPTRSVRTQRYKYIRFFDTEWMHQNVSNIDGSVVKNMLMDEGLAEIPKLEECLYDLDFDVYETDNLAYDPAYADVMADMRARLEAFMRATDDPLLKGPIAVDPAWKVNRRECVQAGSKDPNDYESLGVDFAVRERGMA